MSDRDELRSILSSEESDPGPLDGERAVVDAATESEADEDETNDLSPEDLFAESVRQTNAALGLDDEEEAAAESADATAAEEPDDIAALKEKARLWEEHEASQAQQAVEGQRQAIITEARLNEQTLKDTKQRYRDFYKNELGRLLAQVDADAENTPNPEAYKRANRPAAIANVQAAEDLKLAELDQTHRIAYDALNTRFEAIDQQIQMAQQRPAYTDFLFEKLNLPTDDPQIRQQIMLAGQDLVGEDALNAMTRRAREIAWTVDYLRQKNQTLDQAARDVKAREVKKSQPHPATATNSPRRARPVDYDAPPSERKKTLAVILGSR